MSILRALVLGAAITIVIASCIVRQLAGPRFTGTCDGACEHYVECKSDHLDKDRARCRVECPDAFSDRDSLMAYEGLSCRDAVEYVDGNRSKAAASR